MTDFPRYVVYDSETTITNYNGTAFVLGNEVVVSGSLLNGTMLSSISDGIDIIAKSESEKGTLLVGHNIAFDLQYLFKPDAYVITGIKKGMNVWDTQIAEYVLTGQTERMTSLDKLATKYGGTLKDSYVSDMFAKGIGADKIDKATLIPYLEADLRNTDLVFRAQYEEAKRRGLLPLITYMNMARLMTAIMQSEGLRINQAALLKWREDLDAAQAVLYDDIAAEVMDEIMAYMPADLVLSEDKESMCTDNMLSAYLFGGSVNLDVKRKTGEVFKSGAKKGQPRLKNDTYAFKFKEKHKPYLECKSSRRYSLIHPMDDGVLDMLKGSSRIALKAAELRRIKKLIGTYIDGVLKHSYRHADGYHYVHPDYNHALTATGRLSCARPNLQNVDGDVKKFYLPHPGHAMLLEFDFKQLEVCALAQLSEDRQLLWDINHGVDLHYETGKVVFGWKSPSDMDEKTRRGVKGVNFGLIYGGSAKGLAAQTGFSEVVVKKLIDAFYSRYPGVKCWQDSNIEAAKAGRKYHSGMGHTEKGFPAGQSELVSCTGRRYVFTEYDAPDWMVERTAGTVRTSFSPTEIKNYPVQGFATGDIVPITLGILMQYWVHDDRLYMNTVPVNTVHDSFMFTVKDMREAAYLYKVVTEQVMPTVMEVLKDTFKIDMKVPLNVDAKAGHTWGDMVKFHP